MRLLSRLTLLVGCLMVPNVVVAQSAIAGVVRDSSGAVLPGVTIEVTSPALIEKTRTTVTDASVSDIMPIPPVRARPRMLPTGVSILRQPVSAAWPTTKAKVPRVTPNRAECEVPLASQTNSSSTMRAPPDSMKSVPSMKRSPTRPSAAVSMTSPRTTAGRRLHGDYAGRGPGGRAAAAVAADAGAGSVLRRVRSGLKSNPG